MKCLFLVVVVEELPPVALRILVRLAAFTALSTRCFTLAAASGIFLAGRLALAAACLFLAAFGVNPVGCIYDNGAVAYLDACHFLEHDRRILFRHFKERAIVGQIYTPDLNFPLHVAIDQIDDLPRIEVVALT